MKRKLTVNSLQFTVKTIIFLLFYFTLYAFPVTLASAQESTKAGVLAASASATPSTSIQEKVEALKKEIASKAAALKQEVNKKIQNKVIAGEILEVSDSKITLQSLKGNRTININEYTEYKTSGNKKLTFKNMEKGDYVAALGDMDEKNLLTAKRIVLQDKPPLETEIIWGQIESVSDPNINITGINNKKINITTNSKTIFKLGDEEASILDAKLKKFLVGTGSLNEQKLTAQFIYLIPQVGFYIPEKSKVSTPSATPKVSPSPSAKPTSSPKS